MTTRSVCAGAGIAAIVIGAATATAATNFNNSSGFIRASPCFA